jgi:hypothetical protein
MRWNFSRRTGDIIFDWVSVLVMVALICFAAYVLFDCLAGSPNRPYVLKRVMVWVIACLFVLYRVGSRIVRDFRDELIPQKAASTRLTGPLPDRNTIKVALRRRPVAAGAILGFLFALPLLAEWFRIRATGRMGTNDLYELAFEEALAFTFVLVLWNRRGSK